MTRLSFNAYTCGLIINCENCKKTGTIQEDGDIPNGWWLLADSDKIAGVFCSISCIYHFVSRQVRPEHTSVPLRAGTFNLGS